MKRSPLKRGTSVLKRTPLARVGKRTKAKASKRAAVVRFVHQRDQICMFGFFAGPHIAMSAGCCHGHLDVHEIIPRSAWPDGELEPSNCLLLCRRHHRWVDDHPQVAHQLHLHGMSWERTDK